MVTLTKSKIMQESAWKGLEAGGVASVRPADWPGQAPATQAAAAYTAVVKNSRPDRRFYATFCLWMLGRGRAGRLLKVLGSRSLVMSGEPNSRKLASGVERRAPFMIGVAGGTASGKSTVCERLMEGLGQNNVSVEEKQVSILILFISDILYMNYVTPKYTFWPLNDIPGGSSIARLFLQGTEPSRNYKSQQGDVQL